MSKKQLGRGQLHSRSERSWRDGTNPSGTSDAPDELAPAIDSGDESAPASEERIEASDEGPIGRTTSTDGPGGGGATESAGRAKHHAGLHGGPTRKT